MTMSEIRIVVAAGAASVAAAGAMAHEEGDVGLRLIDGKIRTVLASDEDGDSVDAFLNSSQRVFEAELNVDGFADEPGFYTNSFGGFSSGTYIGYQNIGPLGVWNGTDFDPVVGQELRQLVGPFTKVVDGDAVTEEGFRFLYSGGEFDQHPDLQIALTGSNPAAPGPAGAFLWELSFFASDAASGGNILAESQTVFIVVNLGLEEEAFEEAVEAAEEIIPAPGVAGVLGVAGLLATRRRR